VGACGIGTGAAAHTQVGSLGSAASATDYYQIVCSDDGSGPPVSLALQLQDASPAGTPLVSAQVQRGSQVANTTDPVDADAAAGPVVAINGGGGAYEVLVNKTSAGAEAYVLTFHCLTGPDGTGIHTGTDVLVRQNQ
jgi:hypothetical protein